MPTLDTEHNIGIRYQSFLFPNPFSNLALAFVFFVACFTCNPDSIELVN